MPILFYIGMNGFSKFFIIMMIVQKQAQKAKEMMANFQNNPMAQQFSKSFDQTDVKNMSESYMNPKNEKNLVDVESVELDPNDPQNKVDEFKDLTKKQVDHKSAKTIDVEEIKVPSPTKTDGFNSSTNNQFNNNTQKPFEVPKNDSSSQNKNTNSNSKFPFDLNNLDATTKETITNIKNDPNFQKVVSSLDMNEVLKMTQNLGAQSNSNEMMDMVKKISDQLNASGVNIDEITKNLGNQFNNLNQSNDIDKETKK